MSESIEQELRRKAEHCHAFDKEVMASAMQRGAVEIVRLRSLLDRMGGCSAQQESARSGSFGGLGGLT